MLRKRKAFKVLTKCQRQSLPSNKDYKSHNPSLSLNSASWNASLCPSYQPRLCISMSRLQQLVWTTNPTMQLLSKDPYSSHLNLNYTNSTSIHLAQPSTTAKKVLYYKSHKAAGQGGAHVVLASPELIPLLSEAQDPGSFTAPTPCILTCSGLDYRLQIPQACQAVPIQSTS